MREKTSILLCPLWIHSTAIHYHNASHYLWCHNIIVMHGCWKMWPTTEISYKIIFLIAPKHFKHFWKSGHNFFSKTCQYTLKHFKLILIGKTINFGHPKVLCLTISVTEYLSFSIHIWCHNVIPVFCSFVVQHEVSNRNKTNNGSPHVIHNNISQHIAVYPIEM